MKLSELGFHYLDAFLENNHISILADSYLGYMISKRANKGVLSENYSNLLNLSVAAESLINRNQHIPWLKESLEELSKSPYIQNKIHLNSKVAAEVTAGGLLADVFNELEPLAVTKKSRTPDFKLFDTGYAEVYCPQTSEQNKTAIKEQLELQKDKDIKIAFSRPLTGQTRGAITFPANKVIDRILNQKRVHDQTQLESTNLLWLDLTHGFNVNCRDTQPLITTLYAGTTYTSSFGVWHAFYGKLNESIFPPDRTVLKYSNSRYGFYKQTKEGLFRLRTQLHGAIILTCDGIIFFENPWSPTPLDEDTKKKITRLHRFRSDFSWFQYGVQPLCQSTIEHELAKIDWLYQKNN